MLRRHGGHELVCVHDGYDMPEGVRGIRMPDAVAALPRYYPKVWLHSAELGDLVGRRYACIDLDAIIIGDPAEVFRDVPFTIWDQARGEPYNSSLMAMYPGASRAVWDSFSLEAALRANSAASRWTGDQSWIAVVLGEGVPTFSETDGILQYRPSIHREMQPEGRVVFTCGPFLPDREAMQSDWISEAYR
jgi:hypothetical protein